MTLGIWLGIIVALLVVFGVIRNVMRGRCPQCGAMGKFKKTGNTRVPDNTWGADLFDEYVCAECGHSEWVRQRAQLR